MSEIDVGLVNSEKINANEIDTFKKVDDYSRITPLYHGLDSKCFQWSFTFEGIHDDNIDDVIMSVVKSVMIVLAPIMVGQFAKW